MSENAPLECENDVPGLPNNSNLVYLFFTLLLLLCSACKEKRTEVEQYTPCGGIGGFVCPNEYYCDYGADCGGLDLDGFCLRRPVDCGTEEDEVCGCDNKTYTNSCVANTVGATIRHRGSCRGDEPKQSAPNDE